MKSRLSNGVRYFHAPGREDAPTVVLVHGLGNSLDFWTAVIPLVEKQFATLAFDVPGFGQSDKPSGSFTFDAAATLIAPLLDELEIDNCVVVGHSLGGFLALTMAQQMAAVRRLVLVDATLLTAADCLKDPRIALRHPRTASATLAQFAGGVIPLGQSRARLLAGNVVGRCLTLRPYVYRPSAVDPRLLTLALAGNSGRNVWAAFRAGSSVDVRELMASVKVPVDLAWGAHDPLLTPDDVDAAARLLHVEQRLEIPGCGHWPMIEAPDTLSEFIISSASRQVGE